jgi:hypothetical protein
MSTKIVAPLSIPPAEIGSNFSDPALESLIGAVKLRGEELEYSFPTDTYRYGHLETSQSPSL